MSKPARITADSLGAVDLFRDLDYAEREHIAERLTGLRYDAGALIVNQHDRRNDVFFVLSGTARATFHATGGKDVQFRDMHAGEMFGEISAIDGGPRSAEVTAVSEVFVARAEGSVFLELATTYPVIARQLLARLASLVRSLSDRVVEFSTLGVSNRIHGELLRLAREHGIEGNRATIKPAPTHADIAARVSSRREAVTRELATLTRRGIVNKRRGTLDVVDVQRLEALVLNVADADD